MTFLFTDVVDHSRLWEEFPVAMAPSLERHDELVRMAIEQWDGYVFSTAGDAFGAAFASAEAAAAAAIEAQHALRSEPWPAGCELRVRMGLHTGEAHERGGDYFGSAVIRAARLMSLSHGGQILVSSTAAGLLTERSEHAAMVRMLGEVSLRGLGRPERVHELRYPGLVEEFPALPEYSSRPGNLPNTADELIGRSGALDEADALLSGTSLLSLTGPGGVGKTRLAIEVGSKVSDRFSDGVWFVSLAPVTDATAVPDAVADVLGVQESASRSLTESIVGAIAGRDLLLVLDNCEHVTQGARELIRSVVQECSPVVVLATSREPLGVSGERVLPVEPLPIDKTGISGVAPAVELFGVRAQAADPTFVLDGSNLDVVSGICGRLDGIPLAIELAAARVRGLGLAGLAEHLDDPFRLLRRRGGADVRHQTLRATVGWSYDLLEGRLQEVFRMAGVFAGGFTSDAAEEVLAVDGLDAIDIADGLAELVDKSMVQIVEAPSGRRYRMLETMRQFGAEVIDAGDLQRTRNRFVDFYSTWCDTSDRALRGPSCGTVIRQLRDDFDNVREAQRLAIAMDRIDEAVTIATSMYEFGVRDVNGEPFAWAAELVGRAPRTHPRYSDLLGAAIWGYRARGDRNRANELIAVFEELDEGGLIVPSAHGLHHVAVCSWLLGHTERSLEWHRRSIEQARATGDSRLPNYMSTLSMAEDSFDRSRAERSAREALAIGRAAESPLYICMSLLSLAGVVVHTDPDSAIELTDELIGHARDAELLWFEATGVRLQAHAQSRARHLTEASRTFIRALDLNGVGDFGELLWYTVLNTVEHFTRAGRVTAAATALGALSAARAAPSDDLVSHAVTRMRAHIDDQIDGDMAELEATGASMRLAELIGYLRAQLLEHAAAATPIKDLGPRTPDGD